jgi:hypothetical protein
MKKIIRSTADVTAFGGAALGSFLIASNTGMFVLGYVCFLLSSIASVYLLKITPNAPKALMLQSVYFIGVNVFGLYRFMA